MDHCWLLKKTELLTTCKQRTSDSDILQILGSMATALQLLSLLVLGIQGTVTETPSCPQSCQCTSERLDCSRVAPNVTELQVTGLSIARLPDGAFRGLRHLKMLNLTANGIQAFEKDTFRPLESLRDLHLSRNQMSTVPPDTFAHNRLLYRLYLSGNPLWQAPELRVPSLGWLELDNCSLQELPAAMFNGTPDLVYLSMDRNNLTSWPRSLFRSLAKLRYVHAEDNQLTSLSPRTFSANPVLEMVYLSGNQLVMPKSGPFLSASSLLILEIASNKITNLSVGTFRGLPELRSLKLFGNDIQQLHPGVFAKLNQLKSLDLQNNSLVLVNPQEFTEFVNGSIVNLTGNPLKCDCKLLMVRRFPKRYLRASVSFNMVCSEEENGLCDKEVETFHLGKATDVLTDSVLNEDILDDEFSDIDISNSSANLTLLVPKITPSDYENSPRLAMGIAGAVIIVMVIALTVGSVRVCRKRHEDACDYEDDTLATMSVSPINNKSIVWSQYTDDPEANKTASLSRAPKRSSLSSVPV